MLFCILPLVPIIDILYAPEGVVLEVEIVNRELQGRLHEAGLNEHDEPTGNLEQKKDIIALGPLLRTAVTVVVAGLPCTAKLDAGFNDKRKLEFPDIPIPVIS